MLNLIKKFFLNEWKGIKQAASSFNLIKILDNLFIDRIHPPEEITELKHPKEYKIIKEISDRAGVYPEKVFLSRSVNHNNGQALLKERTINIDRGNLGNEKPFTQLYTHELGHIKHRKLHSHLNLKYANIPYTLLLSATTNMYAVGLSAYAFMGNNKVLDGSNWLFSHTGKYLIAAAVTKAVLIRTREFMADLFAYKHTGLLPSVGIEEKRNGIIGNISGTVSEILSKVESGYPARLERDIVCKILGGKPKSISFVEKLNLERGQTQSNSHHTPS